MFMFILGVKGRVAIISWFILLRSGSKMHLRVNKNLAISTTNVNISFLS